MFEGDQLVLYRPGIVSGTAGKESFLQLKLFSHFLFLHFLVVPLNLCSSIFLKDCYWKKFLWAEVENFWRVLKMFIYEGDWIVTGRLCREVLGADIFNCRY